MPGSQELELERGRRLPCGWGSLLWHPGTGGAKISRSQALGTWSTSPIASGRGTGGAQGPKAPPGDAEVFIPMYGSFRGGNPIPGGSALLFPLYLPTIFAPLEEPQKKQGERFIQWSVVCSVSSLTALFQAEELSSSFSRCAEELHCRTVRARTIAALGSRRTRCF